MATADMIFVFFLLYSQFLSFSSCFFSINRWVSLFENISWTLKTLHLPCQQQCALFLSFFYFFVILWLYFGWFLYLEVDPGPWTKPLQYYSNSRYHFLFFLIFLFIFELFFIIFYVFSIIRYGPWTLNTAPYHHGNSRYYSYFFLIYSQISWFFSCFLLLDIDPEPWILSLWHHGNKKSHSNFLLILFWFSSNFLSFSACFL